MDIKLQQQPHSLGTPLSTITVIAKELKKEAHKNPKITDDIDLLLEQAKKCGDILKKLSRRGIEDDTILANISLQDLIFEIAKSFEEISDKKIKIKLEKKYKFQLKDLRKITYGIRNFVGNAVKFSKNKVFINLFIENENVVLEIIDDGPGFPSDVFKFIGEPYISSKSLELKSKSGLGLGTFIGKTLLERKKQILSFLTLKIKVQKFKLFGKSLILKFKNLPWLLLCHTVDCTKSPN